MLSAATRAALGKRGIAQLEAVKGALEAATGSAALARRDAGELRDEVRSALAMRDEALATAAEARNLQAEAVAQTEEASAVQVLTLSEATRRAERDSLAATKRAETAEARAEAAEAAVAEGERARARMAEALETAEKASGAAAEQTARLEGQLRREREVLAKLMAENVLFVKRLQLSEVRATRASRCACEEACTAWRSAVCTPRRAEIKGGRGTGRHALQTAPTVVCLSGVDAAYHCSPASTPVLRRLSIRRGRHLPHSHRAASDPLSPAPSTSPFPTRRPCPRPRRRSARGRSARSASC